MEQIFSWVLERSLGISVVLLVVMLLQPFLHRRYRPQLNCLVWTALALCLLIPFRCQGQNRQSSPSIGRA